jgi:hypothetical protein
MNQAPSLACQEFEPELIDSNAEQTNKAADAKPRDNSQISSTVIQVFQRLVSEGEIWDQYGQRVVTNQSVVKPADLTGSTSSIGSIIGRERKLRALNRFNCICDQRGKLALVRVFQVDDGN